MQLHTTHIDRVTSKGEKGGGEGQKEGIAQGRVRVERRVSHEGGTGSKGGFT